jgi:hypothetical protein
MIGPSVLVNCRSNDTGDVARHSVTQNVTPLGLTALHFAQPRRKARDPVLPPTSLQKGTRMRRILFTAAAARARPVHRSPPLARTGRTRTTAPSPGFTNNYWFSDYNGVFATNWSRPARRPAPAGGHDCL